MLEINKLVKKYGEKTVVNNLSFHIKKGEMMGLLGVNGAGKTTTFRMILNIIEQSSGTIMFDGRKVDLKNTDEIGYLSEERSLLVKYKVLDQIYYFAKLKGMKKKEIQTEIDYWFEIFEMDQYRNKLVKELSKGNQQKIQFITAIIHKPKLIILDEPFSGLDPLNIELFKNAMNKLIENGSTIIFSSHRMDHVEHFCDNVIIMYNGVPIIQDSVKNLKNNAPIKKVKIIGEFDYESILLLEDVSSYSVIEDEYCFLISEEKTMIDIFNILKEAKYVEKFILELPSLEEIFVDAIKGEKDA